MKDREINGRIVGSAICLAILICSLLPVIFIFGSSFMRASETRKFAEQGAEAIHILPEWFVLEQYKKILLQSPELLYWFWNSVWIALPALAGTFLIAPAAGYGLAKYNIPFKKYILGIYFGLSLLPVQLMLVPNYLTLDFFGLLGSRAALWLPAVFQPCAVFLMYQFSGNIPDECMEAARLEGASESSVFFRISIPQMVPGFAVLWFLRASDLWAMVEQPLLFFQDEMRAPMAIAFSFLVKEKTEVVFAAGVIFLIPVFLSFKATKGYFIESTKSLVFMTQTGGRKVE